MLGMQKSASALDTANAYRPAVRVAGFNYLAALFTGSFLAAFLLYLEFTIASGAVLLVFWTLVPLLAATDKIEFDGKRLIRTGLLPRMWALWTGRRDRIKLSDVENVSTEVVRAIRRGANLRYTYRTAFIGKQREFAILSSRKDYIRMMRAVLPKIDTDLLDHRTLDLRENLADNQEIAEKVREIEFPPADILESSIENIRIDSKSYGKAAGDAREAEKAKFLLQLADELRVSGRLPQAIEAFRRAVRSTPPDAKVLLNFALCLRTYALIRGKTSLDRSARAMMRLAERRAANDAEILARIGECYFQFDDWRRAAAVFRRALSEVHSGFRSLLGLAEIALHEGKIAHVIHNFSAAEELVSTPSLRNWLRKEIEYFSRLHSDEEYLELEIGRISLLEKLIAAKHLALKAVAAGIPIIGAGLIAGDFTLANIGWAISLSSLAVWVLALIASNMLAERIPYDIAFDDN
jgi:tetratricopeptide (TPR) repeat protein